MNNILPYQKATRTLSTKEKVGQLFMPAAFINDTETEIGQLEALIKNYRIGGLCFFHSRASAATNFEGKKEVVHNEQSLETLKKLIHRYQTISKYPLLISIDAEWGLAMRIENTPQYPYAITLGAIEGHTDLIFEVGKNIAHDCKQVGIHWNLAPVTDINNNPFNPVIGYRSFGENKHAVVQKAKAFMDGAKSGGILSCIKHFPGHGDTATDSHLGLPVIDKSKEDLWNKELYPFQELIKHGIDAVMVGHLAVPSLTKGLPTPATISKDIVKGILRKELGFTGVVVSDALNMHGISKMHTTKGELEWLAFDAGIDVLCFAEHVAEGIETILKNAMENEIEDSFERIWKLKERAIGTSAETYKKPLNPDILNRKLALESLTVSIGDENDISDFRKTDFLGIAIGKTEENIFFESISKELQVGTTFLSEHTMMEVENRDTVLLAIFPPQIKPTHNFGISDVELQMINTLIRTKTVVLYLFGNPYVLNKIDMQKAKAIVLVYQDFEVFQQNAAQHFLGHNKANGKLPVSINEF